VLTFPKLYKDLGAECIPVGGVQLNDYSDSRKQYSQPSRLNRILRAGLAYITLACSSLMAQDQQQPATSQPPESEKQAPTASVAPQDEQPRIENPFSRSRFLLYGSLGLEASSLDSFAVLDARHAGLGARAAWNASEFREEISRDRIHKETGRAALEADLEQLLSAPLRIGIATSTGTSTRLSNATSITNSPPFTITTMTSAEETQTPVFFGASASVGLGKGFTVTVAGDYLNNKTAVDLTILTDVKNSNDPAGNYQAKTISRIVSEAADLRGQVTLLYQVDSALSLATTVTAQYVTLKNPDRKTDAYRVDFEGMYLNKEGKYGAGVLAGQEVLVSDDAASRGFKHGDLALIAGASLTDNWVAALRGSYRGNFTGKDDSASGSAIMLFGDVKGILPYILENSRQENLRNIDLVVGLSADMFDDYLRGHNWDVVDAIGRKNRLALLTDLGAARVQTLNGKDTQFVGKVTAFAPISKEFTLSITPAIRYGNLVRSEGVTLGGHFNGPLSFFLDISQNSYEGRLDSPEAVRMMGGLTYIPKSSEKPKE
jgi:hypothetical protein